MTNELACLRIIATFPGKSGIQVRNIVLKSKLQIKEVDAALAGLRQSGFVQRPLVGAWTSPGYTATPAGLAFLGAEQEPLGARA